MSKEQRPISLAFVKEDGGLIHASDISQAPPAGEQKQLYEADMSLLSFYVEDLPDFSNKNEALLKIEINSRDPKNAQSKNNFTFALDFKARDGDYAPGFLSRKIFRSALFDDQITLTL